MKAINRILKNTAGFTLTEVLIGGGILAGIGLAAATMFKDQRFAQKKIDDEQKLTLFHQSLAKSMANTSTCNATFNSSHGTGIPDGPRNILRCASNCDDKKLDAAGIGVDPTPLVSPGKWTDASQIWQVDAINVKTALNKSGNLILQITYMTNPRLSQPRRVNKDIILNMRFDETGGFKECLNKQESSVNNLQNDICKAFNIKQITTDGAIGSWDENEQKCLIDLGRNCTERGMQIAGITSEGIVRCRPVVEGFNSTGTFDSAPTLCPIGQSTKFVYDSTQKKMVVVCQ